MSLFAPWSLRDLTDAIARGQCSTAEAWERSARRIAETEDRLAAWVTRCTPPEPPATAGALSGIPLGVKDIIDVAGYPTRCGSALLSDTGPVPTDAEIVRRWRAAGAVPAGKTVTTEFAFFAPGPTHNPAAPGHTPGGSSSGSAAAVASGQVPLALGSQTAGSVTRPAAYCGVAALVLTRGLLPTDGITGLAHSLDSHGFYAAEVRDLACAWSALMAVADPLSASVRPPRIALWSAEPLDVVDGDMTEAVAALRDRLVADGAAVTGFAAERMVAEATAAHRVVMAYEAARERSAELARADELSRPLADLLRTGAATSDADYAAARGIVDAARRAVLDLLTGCDAIIGPAAPGAAPAGLDATGDPVLSRAWQALGLPVVTVPGLRDPQGLPLGIQVVGAPRAEAELLRVAGWIQDRTHRPPRERGGHP
ncbi:amidase [Nocardia carnea]|uniref:amidase n=1 Tax=Nocardia carnea TaxID=37328 RepID=UPI002454F26B|nr:amidase [Nocardia carnea]